MVRLSVGQLERASEILGNISVAWFSTGIISPLLTKPKNLLDVISTFVVSLLMALVFSVISLVIAKGVKR